MGIRTLEQMEKNSEGGSNYFGLKDKESVKVRFLYNSIGDELPIAVHDYSDNVNKKYATIDCIREEGAPLSDCKHCAAGNKSKIVVYVPIYRVDDQKIYYWKRSSYFMSKTLNPILAASTVPGNTIAGTTYIINRSGTTMQDTVYTILPDVATPYDGKQRTDFGEIVNPLEAGMVSKYDTEFTVQGNTNQQAPEAGFQQTRRTADIF